MFLGYTRSMMRKHFNGVYVGGVENIVHIDRSLPVILYCNHSSWWDGLIAFVISHDVLHLETYLMMEEKQLRRYKFFRLIGAFSVNRESPTAAVESMRYAASLIRRPNTGLWIYPQGVMVPNDTRPLGFYQGAARIAAMQNRVQLVPVAHRYEFLMEQRPEAFSLIGRPWIPEESGSPKQLTAELERRLTNLLDGLRCAVTTNELDGFTRLLTGRASINVRFDRLGVHRGDT